MAETEEQPLPQLPHVAGEFYLWLWWASEDQEAVFDLGDEVGQIELWVDERLAFREPNDTKVTTVLTGDSPSTTLESRAALHGGKVLQEIRIAVRRDDREFYATLKGPGMDLRGVKLPQVITEGTDETLYDRMFLYEELMLVLQSLFQTFSGLRTSDAWSSETLPAMRRWVAGDEP